MGTGSERLSTTLLGALKGWLRVVPRARTRATPLHPRGGGGLSPPTTWPPIGSTFLERPYLWVVLIWVVYRLFMPFNDVFPMLSTGCRCLEARRLAFLWRDCMTDVSRGS